MGMVGWGKAFNLRFMPRTAPKLHVDSFWHRPYLPRGGSLFIKETTNVQIGPSGFWGFIIGLSQGLKGGGMFGINNMWNMQTPAYVNPLATLNAAATPQGPAQAQTAEDKGLEQLNKLYGSKFNIIERPAGKFTATDDKHKLVGSNLSFDEMCEALNKYNGGDSAQQVEQQEQQQQQQQQVEQQEQQQQQQQVQQQEQQHNKPHSKGGKVANGWYRASNDKSSKVNITHKSDGSGRSAQQITSSVLGTKLTGCLNAQQQTELCNLIIRRNPSVFESDGKAKAYADYSKLDVPTMEWIENHFNLQHGATVARHDDIHSEAKGTKTIKGNNGYYVKIDAKGNKTYFDANSKVISPTEFKNNCPNIYKNVNS